MDHLSDIFQRQILLWVKKKNKNKKLLSEPSVQFSKYLQRVYKMPGKRLGSGNALTSEANLVPAAPRELPGQWNNDM